MIRAPISGQLGCFPPLGIMNAAALHMGSKYLRARIRVAAHIVARVQPRTSKGITDLLSLNLILLNTNCPIKQKSTTMG